MKDNLGVRIKKLLKLHNMTQREFAEKLHITEVSVSRYINGKRIPKSTLISDMAVILKTTTDYLLSDNNNEFDIEYQKIYQLIKNNASFMSKEQKINIITELL